jgi:hypothetical protein
MYVYITSRQGATFMTPRVAAFRKLGNYFMKSQGECVQQEVKTSLAEQTGAS